MVHVRAAKFDSSNLAKRKALPTPYRAYYQPLPLRSHALAPFRHSPLPFLADIHLPKYYMDEKAPACTDPHGARWCPTPVRQNVPSYLIDMPPVHR